MQQAARFAAGLAVGALLAVAMLAIGAPRGRPAVLAYTFTPEENPLADFDKDFTARPYGASATPETNPFEDFAGYGLSTSSHPTGVSPYPASKEVDTHNVYDDMPEVRFQHPPAGQGWPRGALARANLGLAPRRSRTLELGVGAHAC